MPEPIRCNKCEEGQEKEFKDRHSYKVSELKEQLPNRTIRFFFNETYVSAIV